MLAKRIEAIDETGMKIFRFFASASLESSSRAGIANRAMKIQRSVPCSTLSSVVEVVREPSIQPSKMTIATKTNVIKVPKSNLCFSIIFGDKLLELD